MTDNHSAKTLSFSSKAICSGGLSTARIVPFALIEKGLSSKDECSYT